MVLTSFNSLLRKFTIYKSVFIECSEGLLIKYNTDFVELVAARVEASYLSAELAEIALTFLLAIRRTKRMWAHAERTIEYTNKSVFYLEGIE